MDKNKSEETELEPVGPNVDDDSEDSIDLSPE